jgi:nucleotide-binding universal stress UspA family protein
MFDNILVPLDGSLLAECALPHAMAMARAFQSQVTLLGVLERGPRQDCRRGVDPLEWVIRKAEAVSYVGSMADRLQRSGLAVTGRMLDGDPAEQIINFAHQNGASLIIMSSHGQGGLTGWNVGSVTQKIVSRARTSTMIVRAFQRKTAGLDDLRYRRLLVPMDGSRRAEWVWPMATTLARSEGAEILLAHVVKPPEMPRRLPLTVEDTELADRIVTRNRCEASQYVEELRSWLPSAVRGRIMVGAQVAAALHQLAEEEHVDLVVLSAHGYSGGTRFLYGGVVTSFIIYGSTPLLIMQDVPIGELELNPAETIRAADNRALRVPQGTFGVDERWQSIGAGSPNYH